MPYIKKLYAQGFKSFAKPTEIVFDKGMNVIIGPNGSGKSNIIDAMCFVLGRLSAKSMRASSASHLIYNGGKNDKPASTAKVSLIFDNTDRLFSLNASEIEVARIVKRDGASVYKINNETKTRQEVLELLAQAGIDPEGFNIILQTQIDTIIKMRSEEKRQIIEEVAGISIYEDRKEKSLHELEKTDTKLKEIKTILNERTAFLNNLEKERKQALRYEHLKEQVQRCKFSILSKKMDKKNKDVELIDLNIKEKEKNIEKTSNSVAELRKQVEGNNTTIFEIEKKIEKETGIEQDKLRSSILELKTELAGMEIKKENTKDQIENSIKKEEGNKEEKNRLKEEIGQIEERAKYATGNKDKGERVKFEAINSEIDKIKAEIQEVELKQKIVVTKKSEIERKSFFLEEKEKRKNEIIKHIRELEEEISKSELKKIDEEDIHSKKAQHEKLIQDTKSRLENLEHDILKLATRKEIQKKDVEEILTLDQCPKCKQKITKEYKDKLVQDVWSAIKIFEKEIENKEKNKQEVQKEVEKLAKLIEKFIDKEKEIIEFNEKKKIIESKKSELEKEKFSMQGTENEIQEMRDEISKIKKEIPDSERLDKKRDDLYSRLEKFKEDLLKVKLKQPVQLYLEKDFDTEVMLKHREIEQCERNVKQAQHDKIELEAKFKEFMSRLDQLNKQLRLKQQEQELIEKKFNKLISEKQNLQEQSHSIELRINENQLQKNLFEQQINEMKIEKARTDAEFSTLQEEAKNFGQLELIKVSMEELEDRLHKYDQQLLELGTVNMRALEVYDKVKAEYDEIEQKVKKLDEEKGEILKVIAEIDKKKKQAFMQAFNGINKHFSENFVSLSNKGMAFLELENKDNIFDGGVNILIKLGKGKYMDSNSLSGGEKVIVALSLIFAIQKYKPYHFYIFDEIDAALDKRNSEKLSSLVGKDAKSQYIVITHNDVMMNNASTIYGASMQEGITKVVGLKV